MAENQNQEHESLEKYGLFFQEKLGYVILYDSVFADQIQEVLELSYISVRHVREVIKIIFEHKLKYGLYPSYELLASVLIENQDKWNDTEKTQIENYYMSLYDEMDYRDIDPVKEMSLKFCKNEALKKALLKIVDMMKAGTIDDADKLVTEALLLGSDNDLGFEPLDNVREIFAVDLRHPIPLGMPVLDKLFSGGLGRGEIGAVSGMSNSGKTTTLVAIAVGALLAGFNVVYYTLEIGKELLAERFVSSISKFPKAALELYIEDVDELCKNVEGKLLIKHYPTSCASFLTIKNHLEKVKRTKWKPDLVIIDYPELMDNGNERDEWKMLTKLYQKIRGLAGEFNIGIWVASQLNSSGYNSEELDMSMTAGSLGKNNVLDIMLGVKRTSRDERDNRATLFVMKSRVSSKGQIFKMYYDASTVQLDILEPGTEQAIVEERQAEIDAQQESIRKILEKVKTKVRLSKDF
jgi:replicative DNA helicase